MQLSDFDYKLPKELIAQYPLEKRDMARLLVLDRLRGSIGHCVFKDIKRYLLPADLLVLNNSKVLPARLSARRLTGGKVDILLLRRKNGLVFDALIRPARVRQGEEIIFNGGRVSAKLSARNEIDFSARSIDEIYKIGKMPLPPYIKREAEGLDSIYYQTVYAKSGGSIAAPTAGLHFTTGLLARIKSAGVNITQITLHIGYATFKPVKAGDIKSHRMEKEYFEIPLPAQRLVEKTKTGRGRVIAVGTTACRALEAYAAGNKEGSTDLFIYPGYKFKAVDCLLTNFHLPRTTLFMLVSAFAGKKLIKKAYQEAIDKKYRFYSYGDAMLIV